MKKERIADELLDSLQEALLMENDKLKGHETFRESSNSVNLLYRLGKILRNFAKKIQTLLK